MGWRLISGRRLLVVLLVACRRGYVEAGLLLRRIVRLLLAILGWLLVLEWRLVLVVGLLVVRLG